jgi:hypothetical protein
MRVRYGASGCASSEMTNRTMCRFLDLRVWPVRRGEKCRGSWPGIPFTWCPPCHLIDRGGLPAPRFVDARSLVSPITDRHLFTWRRLGTLLGADHKAIQRWHAQGIDLIVKALRGGER